METGYYWALNARDNKWQIVEIAARLPEHVLFGGYAWPRAAYSNFTGPLRPPDGQLYPENLRPLAGTSDSLIAAIADLALKLETAHTELHDLRIRAGLGDASHD